MFGTASGYLIADLVGDFRKRYPGVRLRLVGQNSSLVADAVRAGRLEAALVVLPVDDEGLELRPVHREELVVVGRSPERLGEAMTIERLAELPLVLYDAEYGWADPMRRQLDERAQLAGIALEPAVEVEDLEAAIQLARARHRRHRRRASGARHRPRDAFPPRRALRGATLGDVLLHRAARCPRLTRDRAFIELVERRLARLGELILYQGAQSREPRDALPSPRPPWGANVTSC